MTFFNSYRLVLSALLISAYVTEVIPNFLGYSNEEMFFWASLMYGVFALSNFITIRHQWLSFQTHAIFWGILDIVVLTQLMHASGGVSSGLGMLMIVAIAGASALTEGRTAMLFAAIASLCVLAETLWSNMWIHSWLVTSRYTHASMLGVTFFATALLSHVLARRIRASETLAQQRGLSLQYLAQLNEEIVQSIQSGILVIDGLNRIWLCNQAAIRLLGLAVTPAHGQRLSAVSPELFELLSQWKQRPLTEAKMFHPHRAEVDLLVSLSRLSRSGEVSILIVVEDASLTNRRAQELKLASLGRLTASIAHEIRNPLGAISHASQLLAESESLRTTSHDRRLVQIIIKHCQRMNNVVENVLQLSRQGKTQAQEVELNEWTLGFIADFLEQTQTSQELSVQDIELRLAAQPLWIAFDPGQLRQIVWNLCDNGLRYSQGTPKLILASGVNAESQRVYLDIRDHGQGMSAQVAAQIFEPFFTTEVRGTGLGLFLSRELCERNQAVLHLLENRANGCTFRISFPARTM